MPPGKVSSFAVRLILVSFGLMFSGTVICQDLPVDKTVFFDADEPFPVFSHSLYVLHGTGPSEPRDFFITFNLEKEQSVQYELVDSNGRRVVRETLRDVINQTFRIESEQAAGLYILRIRIGERYYVEKLYLG